MKGEQIVNNYHKELNKAKTEKEIISAYMNLKKQFYLNGQSTPKLRQITKLTTVLELVCYKKKIDICNEFHNSKMFEYILKSIVNR